MADINKFIPKLLKFEGGYVNDKDDPGGATNLGVTLATWKTVGKDKDGDGDIDENDIKKLTPEDAKIVIKKYYWDTCHADEIKFQPIAELLVDFMYNSGGVAITKLQKILGVVADGVIGPSTLKILNNTNMPEAVFESLKKSRINFIEGIIAKRPVLGKYKKGWLNRINSYKWAA